MPCAAWWNRLRRSADQPGPAGRRRWTPACTFMWRVILIAGAGRRSRHAHVACGCMEKWNLAADVTRVWLGMVVVVANSSAPRCARRDHLALHGWPD